MLKLRGIIYSGNMQKRVNFKYILLKSSNSSCKVEIHNLCGMLI